MLRLVETHPNWRQRAEEARRLAAEARDDQMAEMLARLAEAYEALAQRAEKVAASGLDPGVGGTESSSAGARTT